MADTTQIPVGAAARATLVARANYYLGRGLNVHDAWAHALAERNKAFVAEAYGPALFAAQPDEAKAVRQAMRLTGHQLRKGVIAMALRDAADAEWSRGWADGAADARSGCGVAGHVDASAEYTRGYAEGHRDNR
jgi:hypothetical protein